MTGGPFVDVSKFPPDERPHIIDMAVKVNAIKEDVDGISGVTPEDKAATYAAMGRMRQLVQILHGQRVNAALLSFQAYIILAILKQFGVQPDQFNHLFDVVIKLLEKFANQ